MKLVKEGVSVLFFPEGTRTTDGAMAAFKVSNFRCVRLFFGRSFLCSLTSKLDYLRLFGTVYQSYSSSACSYLV